MPQRKSAKKELKKNIKKRKENLRVKHQLKSAIKKLKKSIESKNPDYSTQALRNVYKTLDKAASKKVIHHNKAARKKSRLSRLLTTLKVEPSIPLAPKAQTAYPEEPQ